MFAIGAQLYSWLARKKLVGIKKSSELNKKTKKKKQPNDKFQYIKLNMPSYVECLFDINLLPFNMPLPMVYQPLDWKKRHHLLDLDDNNSVCTVRDLTGGYLSSDPNVVTFWSTLSSVLSTRNEECFNIQIEDCQQAHEICRAPNKFPKQPFQINVY